MQNQILQTSTTRRGDASGGCRTRRFSPRRTAPGRAQKNTHPHPPIPVPVPGHRLTPWHDSATWSERQEGQKKNQKPKTTTHNRGTSGCDEEGEKSTYYERRRQRAKNPGNCNQNRGIDSESKPLIRGKQSGLCAERIHLSGCPLTGAVGKKFLRKFQGSPFFLPSKSENSDAFLIPKTGPSSN